MADSLRSDGKAVNVTYSRATPKAKGNPELLDEFHGILMQSASSGDEVALEIAQREHEITVGAGITAAKGDILYIDTDGAITNTNSDRPFMKVTVAKDASNIVWGIILPQKTE
jgi:hypothetical protein